MHVVGVRLGPEGGVGPWSGCGDRGVLMLLLEVVVLAEDLAVEAVVWVRVGGESDVFGWLRVCADEGWMADVIVVLRRMLWVLVLRKWNSVDSVYRWQGCQKAVRRFAQCAQGGAGVWSDDGVRLMLLRHAHGWRAWQRRVLVSK